MTNIHEEKTDTAPVINSGIFTPIDPITGSVGEESGELIPEVPKAETNAKSDAQENTPGHHRADRALEYDDPEDVQEEHR